MANAARKHLRSPLDADPEATVLHHLQHREENFLSLVRKVLANSKHPYTQIFEAAGCTYCDVEGLLRQKGLEGALASLLDSGVYLTQDEYRGRTAIVRGRRHIAAASGSWDNDTKEGDLENVSSGTGGRSLVTRQSTAHIGFTESSTLLLVKELDLARRATISIAPILPGFGIVAGLVANRLHMSLDRWYAIGGATSANLHYRVATKYLVAQMRLFGAKMPYPTYLDPNDFSPVAHHLVERHAEGTRTAVVGFVSSIARVAAAAVDEGLDLSGCSALVIGEALTDAKRRVIESAGIKVYPTYGTSDFGNIGYPCCQMKTGNRVHVFRHAAGLIARRQTSSYTDHAVDALYATTLLPFAPRLFINVELGDSGTIEPATCDCNFSRLGLNVQVRDMAAISKVTAQGMTVGADELVTLLEEALPAKFGGRPGDYQLVETEAGSQTEVILLIRPGVTQAKPEDVLQSFLGEARRVYGGSLSVLSWVHSNGIRAEFATPISAGTGKFRAIRLLGSGVKTRRESDGQKRV